MTDEFEVLSDLPLAIKGEAKKVLHDLCSSERECWLQKGTLGILFLLIKKGSDQAKELVLKRLEIKNLINANLKMWFVDGHDRDDLEQEMKTAILQGAVKYDPVRFNVPPTNYAGFCIRYCIISLINASRRFKRSPGAAVLALEDLAFFEGRSWEEVISGSELTLVDYEGLEGEVETYALRLRLSAFEKDVLRLRARGHTYGEIADKLECRNKSVDNALSRIKLKAEKYMGVLSF